ncbi:MAG: hypothetical protein J0I92_17025, partial [Phyllobacterium sp.]|nr:hypothetical protein [Phyllobacterium sp.]
LVGDRLGDGREAAIGLAMGVFPKQPKVIMPRCRGADNEFCVFERLLLARPGRTRLRGCEGCSDEKRDKSQIP